MSDNPSTLILPNAQVVGTADLQCLVQHIALSTNGTMSSAIWTTANTALYVPITLEIPITVIRMGIHVGTQSGNCDVGIYDEKGNRIVSKGSTAVGAAGLQTFDMTASVSGTASPTLSPGTYFMAMNVDNVTAAFFRTSNSAALCRISGVQQQAVGAVTLPATATFANPGGGYVPGMCIAGVAL